jgi:hypothetical protein
MGLRRKFKLGNSANRTSVLGNGLNGGLNMGS